MCSHVMVAGGNCWTHMPAPERIHQAIIANDHTMLQVEINAGNTTCSVGQDGLDAMMLAAKYGRVGCLHLLITSFPFLEKISCEGKTALHYAALYGQYDCVEMLLKHGALVDVRDVRNKTPAMMAAENGSSAILELLIAFGANLYLPMDDMKTALHLAAFGGKIECVVLIALSGFNLNMTDLAGQTALMIAAFMGHTECVIALIRHGADLDLKTQTKETALTYALAGDRTDCFVTLLEAGINPLEAVIQAIKTSKVKYLKLLANFNVPVNVVDRDGKTTLMHCANTGNRECFIILINADGKVEAQDIKGKTALMYAAERGLTDFMALLIDAGASVNTKDKNGDTAMTYAIEGNYINCVRLLVSFGFPLDTRDLLRKTPLMKATRDDRILILEFLITVGSDLNAICLDKNTALMYAAENGQLACVQTLLQHGAMIDFVNSSSNNALACAAKSGSFQCFKLLFKAGATKYKSSDFSRLVYFAEQNSGIEILRLLIKQNNKIINSVDTLGNTLLMRAVTKQNKEMVKMLLEEGGNPNVSNQGGIAPLLYAVATNQAENVNMLLKSKANPNPEDDQAKTALVYACIQAPSLCETLLRYGADTSKRDVNKVSPLMYAIPEIHLDSWRILLDNTSKVDEPDHNGMTALLYACRYGNTECVRQLIRRGVDVNTKDCHGRTALMIAAKYTDDILILKMLWSDGATVNDVNCYGETALTNAVQKKNTIMSNLLLVWGANPTHGLLWGRTILEHLIQENCWWTVLDCFIHSKDMSKTMITLDAFNMIITNAGRETILPHILKNGIVPAESASNPHIISRFSSPLKLAVLADRFDIARYLIANTYIFDYDLTYRPTAETEPNMTKNQLDFFKEIHSKPWPLCKISLIRLSTHLGPSPLREEKLAKLTRQEQTMNINKAKKRKVPSETPSEIPSHLERTLRFSSPAMKLCMSVWSSIPLTFDPKVYEATTSGRSLRDSWPIGRKMQPCNKCEICDGKGLGFKSEDSEKEGA